MVAALKAGSTGESMVAPVIPSLLMAEAQRQKVSARPLLRGLHIDEVDLDAQSDMISHRAATTVVRRGLRLLALADRGLELGLATRVTQRGILALGLLAAPTLGDAIRLSLRYPQRAGYLVHIREEIAGEASQLIAEPFLGDQDIQDFLVDLTFTAVVVLRRQVTGTPYKPALVEFVRQAPLNRAAYVSFFGCPMRFGCPRNVLSTSAQQLEMVLPWANNMAYGLSSRLLQRESEQLDRMSALGHSVERAVRKSLPRIAALAEVAAALNVSERTLRRQLADAGLSFRALLDDSRKSRALDLMAGGHRTIAQVAEAVGFAHARAFARAFLRWTGHTPTSVRNRYAAAPAADQSQAE
jgi:AraC-like DNA-binding protein